MRGPEAYRDEIRAIAIDRQVQFLFHFTQTANLTGIIAHGLLPRRELQGAGYSAFASDVRRLDENDEAVSVSVSRINQAMFAAKRALSGHGDWVVLVLSSHILWTHDCVFCWANAATSEIKKHRGWRGGPWAFDKMFDGSPEDRQSLPSSFPTDPAAEVQVLDRIAPQCIAGAIVDHPQLVEPVQALLAELGGNRPVVIEEIG
jgi:hypothetical protein